jgi:hypothetical protein
MTEDIEKILRKAPQPKVPAHLREKLEADIMLPRGGAEQAKARTTNEWRPLFKRWLPAFSFSALFFASLIAIAVQANILSDLRRENGDLRAPGEMAQHDTTSLQSPEALRLEQLRKDAAEVERLRQEIAEFGAQTEQLAALRAQNQQLKGRLQVAQSQTSPEEDVFGQAQEKAMSVQCVSNLKQISLGARMWVKDHNDHFPPDLLSLKEPTLLSPDSSYVSSPRLLTCPADTAKTKAATWKEFGAANLSYEFLAGGLSKRESPNTVMLRCPVHGHVGLLDGSVHGGVWQRATQKNGRWVIER